MTGSCNFWTGSCNSKILKCLHPYSDQPFSEVENPNLRQIFHFLKTDVITPSADTIKNEVMRTFDKERTCLRETLQVYRKAYHIFLYKNTGTDHFFKKYFI